MAASARLEARDLARIAIFAALIVERGALAVLVVVVLAAVGLPVLSGGRGGLGVFVGPSAGYLFGWIPGVIVTGLIARAGARGISWWRALLGAVVGGILVVYTVGTVGLSLVLGLSPADAALSNVVFLPGDLAKAVVAMLLAVALWRAYPPAFAFAAAPRPAAPRETVDAAR